MVHGERFGGKRFAITKNFGSKRGWARFRYEVDIERAGGIKGFIARGLKRSVEVTNGFRWVKKWYEVRGQLF